MVTITPLIHATVALVVILSAWYSYSICLKCPVESLDSVAESKSSDAKGKLTPRLNFICIAHSSISKLEPISPDKPTILFSVLGLDHAKPPFYPADECATPYNTNQDAASEAVGAVWGRYIDRYGYTRGIIGAVAVLSNQDTRDFYAQEMLPKILKNGEKGWRDMCEGA